MQLTTAQKMAITRAMTLKGKAAAQVPVKHKKKKSHSLCSKAGRKLRTCTKKK